MDTNRYIKRKDEDAMQDQKFKNISITTFLFYIFDNRQQQT